MIDNQKLNIAYSNDGFYALQLEVGDQCFQGCTYCYMNALENPKNILKDEQIIQILYDAKKLDITAIEWLGGEPLLHPKIFYFLEVSAELGFRNNMWTGGLILEDKNIVKNLVKLCQFGLISVHLSTINPKTYKALHPERPEKDIETIINGVKELLSEGYPASQILNSVTFTGYQTAEDMIETIEYFKNNFNIQTSLNIYHTYLRPGYSKESLNKFIPDNKELAILLNYLKKEYGSDNIPMNCVNKQYCSATIAVLNNGYVTPCATIREEREGCNINDFSFFEIANKNRDYLIFKKLKDKENLNSTCQKCNLNEICWGCRSRAYAIGNGIYGADPRCLRQTNVEKTN